MTTRKLMALILGAALLMWAGREILIASDREESARLAWLKWSIEINMLKDALKRGYTEHTISVGGGGREPLFTDTYLFDHADVLWIRGRIAQLERQGRTDARLGVGKSAAETALANQELGLPPWATGIQRIVARLQGEGKPTPEDIDYREELKSHGLPEDSSLFSLLMRRLSGNTPGRDAAHSAVAVALAESRYVYHELEYRRLEREYRRCEARVAHSRISLAYDEELFRWGLLGRSGVVLPGQIGAILRNRRFCPLTPFALELERYSFKLEERRRDKLALKQA